MTGALAIASVTAVLKNQLDNWLIKHDITASGGAVSVTVLPPDRIPVGDAEPSQLNLFMYCVTPHSRLPRISQEDHGKRASRPPLALDLHYLLTAYGRQEFEAEILLGHAIQLLHETPVLARDAISSALASIAPGGAALSASKSAAQVEEIEVRPEFLNTEEMSKLWSALQARYRPSAAYKVSAVLIEADR